MNEIGISLDTVWMLLAAMLVFWMRHVGFLDAARIRPVRSGIHP